MRRIRLGVAGLGRIGLVHASNLAGRIATAELVRVVDADEALASSVAARLGVDWSTSFDSLPADPDVDAVVLATPTPLHASMIDEAGRAGKHVFCEKPIATNLTTTIQAVKASRAAGVKLQIGLQRRFDPDWLEARARIKDGELGQIYFLRICHRDRALPSVDYLEQSGGFFLDATIHDLHMARWLVDEIDEVTAIGAALSDRRVAQLGDVDNALVVLRFASGALGAIDSSRVAGYGYECSTKAMGSLATVRTGRQRRHHNEWLRSGASETDWIADFVERYSDAYLLEIESFVEAIAQAQEPRATGEDAAAAYVLARTCQRSLRDRRPVPLEHHPTDGGVVYTFAGVR